jgi:hypothetical protein
MPFVRHFARALLVLVVVATSLVAAPASAQAPPQPESPAPSLGAPAESFSLLAVRDLRIERDVVVSSGNVGTAQPGGTARLEQDVAISDPASVLAADELTLRSGVTVQDAAYNTIDNAGTIAGTVTSPVSVPITTLPGFVPASPGTDDIDVGQNEAVSLAVGAYGDLDVQKGATVTLTGGRYDFESWAIAMEVTIVAAAPVEVHLAGGAHLNKDGSVIGAMASSRQMCTSSQVTPSRSRWRPGSRGS